MNGDSTRRTKHSEIALSDFITKSIRDTFGLWYDEFRGVYGPVLLNGALLSNGESFLTLTFEREKRQGQLRQGQLHTCVSIDEINFVVYGQVRTDSRHLIDNEIFARVVQGSVREFAGLAPDVLSKPAVGLLSMEIQYDETSTDDPQGLVETLVGAYVETCPDYRSTFADQPGFTMLREPGVWWGQATFEDRIEEAVLVSRLRRELPTLPSQILGKQEYWPTTSDSYLRKIGLLARYF